MSDTRPPAPAKEGRRDAALRREARLKAALKANMAKRKAQAKARGPEGAAPQSDSEA